MNISVEYKKVEALKRMQLLQLSKSCIRAFKDDEVWASEYGTGILYDLSEDEELINKIKEIESQYNILVYHVVKDLTPFGSLVTMFYVSDDQEEWKEDREWLSDKISCCYVWNRDDDYCSEFGDISFNSTNGGLKRIN